MSSTSKLNDAAKKQTKKTMQAAQNINLKLKKKAKDFQSPIATLERFTNLTIRKDKRSTTMPTPKNETAPDLSPKVKLQRSNSANSLRKRATTMMKNAIQPKSSEKKVQETSSAPSVIQTSSPSEESRERSGTLYLAIPSKELFNLTHAPLSHNNNYNETLHPTYGSILLPSASSGECGSIQLPVRAIDDSCIGNPHYQSIPSVSSKFTPPTPKRTPRKQSPKGEITYGTLPAVTKSSTPSTTSSSTTSSPSCSYGSILSQFTNTQASTSAYGTIPAHLQTSKSSSPASSYGSLPSFLQQSKSTEAPSTKKKGKLSSDSEEEEVRERIQVISHKLSLWMTDHEFGNDAASLDDIAQAVWELEVLGRLLNVDTSGVRASSRDLIQIRKQPLSSLPNDQLEEKRKNLEELLQKLREDL